MRYLLIALYDRIKPNNICRIKRSSINHLSKIHIDSSFRMIRINHPQNSQIPNLLDKLRVPLCLEAPLAHDFILDQHVIISADRYDSASAFESSDHIREIWVLDRDLDALVIFL